MDRARDIIAQLDGLRQAPRACEACRRSPATMVVCEGRHSRAVCADCSAAGVRRRAPGVVPPSTTVPATLAAAIARFELVASRLDAPVERPAMARRTAPAWDWRDPACSTGSFQIPPMTRRRSAADDRQDRLARWRTARAMRPCRPVTPA